jgi:hypothetical protein
VRRLLGANVKMTRTMTIPNPRLVRLGLLGGRQPSGSPPLRILVARAGWDSLWIPVDDDVDRTQLDTLRVGTVVDDVARLPTGTAHLWLRGDAARRGSESVRAVRDADPALHDISADAHDVRALEELRGLGVVPVVGPASLDVLLDLLRHCDGNAAVHLPASPGRTEAEAQARLARDPELEAAAASANALVGTLEQCLECVRELQAAGMSELRLRLPATADLADVIAQISVVRGGFLARVQPGTARSQAPEAPAGWGGRA